jgi:nitrate reductase beta subunit
VKEQKGAKYKREECGVVVVIDEPCRCEQRNLACCGVPMVEMAPKTNVKKKLERKK